MQKHTSELIRTLARGTALVALVLGAVGCATQNASPPAPTTAASATYEYKVGPGDTLNINVWRNPELSSTVPVRPDGKVSTPLVDELVAQGKTPVQIARDVEKALANAVAATRALPMRRLHQPPTTQPGWPRHEPRSSCGARSTSPSRTWRASRELGSDSAVEGTRRSSPRSTQTTISPSADRLQRSRGSRTP